MKPLNCSILLLAIIIDINLSAQQSATPVVRTHYHQPKVAEPSSDTVWKATFTYDLNTSTYIGYTRTYFPPVNFGENVIISNLKIHPEIGSIQNLIDVLYNEALAGRQLLEYLNWYMLKPSEEIKPNQIDSILCIHYNSSGDYLKKPIYVPFKEINFQEILLYQEWFYDAISKKIITNIPNASLGIHKDFTYEYSDPNSEPGFEFSSRSDDSVDFTKLLYKPEIVWAKSFLLPKLWKNDSVHYGMDTVNAIPLKTMSIGKYAYGYHTNLEGLIFSEVRERKIIAYTYDSNSLKPLTQITKKGLDTILTKWIMLCDSCSDPIRAPIDHFDLAGMKVVQEIYLNKRTFKFESRIIRVAPLLKAFDLFGAENPEGKPKPLFWVKFDE
jgi:hypothetical protein